MYIKSRCKLLSVKTLDKLDSPFQEHWPIPMPTLVVELESYSWTMFNVTELEENLG